MKKKLFVFFVVLLLFITLNLQPIQSFESNKFFDTKDNTKFTKYQKNLVTFDNQKTFPITQLEEENWYKHYGHYFYDKITPTCVCKTHDNGYAISGYARQDPNLEEDIFILKLDKHGEPIIIYYYDFFNGYNYAYDIKEIQKTTAGEYSYILTGLSTVKEFPRDLLVMEVNADDGSIIWAYGYDVGPEDFGKCIQPILISEQNGVFEYNYVICGYSSVLIYQPYEAKGRMIYLDSVGNLIHAKKYESTGEQNHLISVEYKENNVGDLEFTVGGIDTDSTIDNFGHTLNLKLEEDLNIKYAHKYYFYPPGTYLSKYIWIHSMKKTYDNKLIFSGTAIDYIDNCIEMFLLKTNSDGEIIDWVHTYRHNYGDVLGGTIDEAGHSINFLTAGTIYFDWGLENMFCAKISDTGDIIWNHIYQAGLPDYNCHTNLNHTMGGIVNDGVFLGTTESTTINLLGIKDIVLAKPNYHGKIRWDECCYETLNLDKKSVTSDIINFTGNIWAIDILGDTEITNLKDSSSIYPRTFLGQNLCYGSLFGQFLAPNPENFAFYLFDNQLFSLPFLEKLGLYALIIGQITLKVNALTDDGDEGIDKVEFYIGNEKIYTCEDKPYEVKWKDIGFGKKDIKAIAYDLAGTNIELKMKVLKLL